LSFDLVAIGNPVYDIIVTPSVTTDGRVLSGCSTNACLAAKRLGLRKVGLVGCIGLDFTNQFHRDMRGYGIEVEMGCLGDETGGFRLVYDDRGDRTLDVLGVAGRIKPKDIPDEYLRASFFLIGPILGEVDLELVEFIRTSTSSKLLLDPQGMVRVIGSDRRIVHKCDQVAFGKVARLVDFVKPNEHEARTITGLENPEQALLQLKTFGPAVPIVTLAERGSILIEGDRMVRIPAFRTNAIDPTGAGDAYAGSFLTEYARSRNLVESALFASAAASIMVEQIGPDFVMTLKEVEKRRDSIRGLIRGERLGQ
jgi:sugar/nucleoside kinase (ribokinase family)